MCVLNGWLVMKQKRKRECQSMFVLWPYLRQRTQRHKKVKKMKNYLSIIFDFEIGHAFHFSFFHYYYYYSYTFIYIQRNERRQSLGVPRFGNVIFYPSLLCLVIPKNFGLYTEVINYLTQILILKMVINVD